MTEKPVLHPTQRIGLMLCDKPHIEFCVTCFENLLLQLMSMGMMHSLWIFKTNSKYHFTKAFQDLKVD
jgi:hypothetical protein